MRRVVHRHFTNLIFALLVFLSGVSSTALACQIGWRSPAELEEEAKAVVTAKIISGKKLYENFASYVYGYEIEIESAERGELSGGPMRVTYTDLRAHLRGTMRVCPLKHGSGIEHALEPGQRYRLFLGEEESREILLARKI